MSVVRHLLLNSQSISRSQTDSRPLGHLTPCLIPQCPSLPFYLNFFLLHLVSMYVSFFLHPAKSPPILTCVFISLSPGFSASFSPRHHHFSLFLPPTGWAVKQELAHGRPLTTRNTALELCCRGNDCRLFHTTSGTSMVVQHKWDF